MSADTRCVCLDGGEGGSASQPVPNFRSGSAARAGGLGPFHERGYERHREGQRRRGRQRLPTPGVSAGCGPHAHSLTRVLLSPHPPTTRRKEAPGTAPLVHQAVGGGERRASLSITCGRHGPDSARRRHRSGPCDALWTRERSPCGELPTRPHLLQAVHERPHQLAAPADLVPAVPLRVGEDTGESPRDRAPGGAATVWLCALTQLLTAAPA